METELVYLALDYFTESSLRFDQVESDQPPHQPNLLQELIDSLEANKSNLPPEVKLAYDAYWDNEIATMEM